VYKALVFVIKASMESTVIKRLAITTAVDKENVKTVSVYVIKVSKEITVQLDM